MPIFITQIAMDLLDICGLIVKIQNYPQITHSYIDIKKGSLKLPNKNSIDWVRLSGQSLRIQIFSDMEVTGFYA